MSESLPFDITVKYYFFHFGGGMNFFLKFYSSILQWRENTGLRNIYEDDREIAFCGLDGNDSRVLYFTTVECYCIARLYLKCVYL